MKHWSHRAPIAGQTAVVQVKELQVEAGAVGVGAERALGGALEGQGEKQGPERVALLDPALRVERLRAQEEERRAAVAPVSPRCETWELLVDCLEEGLSDQRVEGV